VPSDIPDQEKGAYFSKALKNSRSYLNFYLIIPNHAIECGEWDLGESESRNFDIHWTAQNGAYHQKLKLTRVRGGFGSMGTKVIKDRVISEAGFVLDPSDQEERYIVLYQSNFN